METVQELIADANRGARKLKEWAQTKEYQDSCAHFVAKCESLIEIANTMLVDLDRITKICEEETVRKEYASGCKYMHRGYYAPTPVGHLIVIGLKRGKLLKQLTSRCKPCFAYGFDSKNRLLWSNQLLNGKVTATEYLRYDGDKVHGITIDSRGILQVVTEEIFQDGRIAEYTKYTIITNELRCEQYTYNEEVIESCQWHNLFIPPTEEPAWEKELGFESVHFPIYRKDIFYFEHNDNKIKLKSN